VKLRCGVTSRVAVAAVVGGDLGGIQQVHLADGHAVAVVTVEDRADLS
jgi:hypothetical protein